MRLVIGWTILVGLLWAIAVIALQVAAAIYPHTSGLSIASQEIMAIGAGVGSFIRPVLQLALILLVLIAAGKQVGMKLPAGLQLGALRDLSSMTNVQAFIAVVIVSALCISALGGVGQVTVLKDLALVVVGFYFGSRRRREPGEDAGASSPDSAAPAPPP